MDLLLIAFGVPLIVGGLGLLIYALVLIAEDNYKPRHTRSTYLPPKR
jgi:hypothetical protein